MNIELYERAIKTLEESYSLLQKKADADDNLIKVLKEKEQLLKAEITFLKEANKKLKDSGDELCRTCSLLEEICNKQQEQLEAGTAR